MQVIKRVIRRPLPDPVLNAQDNVLVDKKHYFTRARVNQLIKISGPCELLVSEISEDGRSFVINITLDREHEVIK